jgi:hypothetical protein
LLPNVFKIFKIRVVLDDRMLGGAGLRASPLVFNTWCSKIFLTSKFSYLFFATPPIKLKLGLQIGGRLLIANHTEQSFCSW